MEQNPPPRLNIYTLLSLFFPKYNISTMYTILHMIEIHYTIPQLLKERDLDIWALGRDNGAN